MVHVMTSTAIMIVEIIFTFAVACDRHRNWPCCQVARLPLPRGGHCQPYGIRCPHGWHALGSRSRWPAARPAAGRAAASGMSACARAREEREDPSAPHVLIRYATRVCPCFPCMSKRDIYLFDAHTERFAMTCCIFRAIDALYYGRDIMPLPGPLVLHSVHFFFPEGM